MKAIILAGGKGTRLSPLTSRTPKPLVRVLDQPVMAHILALLAHYGVKEAAVTVSYLAHEIRNRFGEEFGGVRLHYSHEETPLGTAGGVLAATELFDADSEEDILVISGDAVCDFDLKQAERFHREREAEATLLLKHSEHPLAYGVVKCREDGGILGFVEKPEWSEVCSDRVNTGIYFLKRSALERIPRNTQYDFSADLFAKMLSERARLFGCLCEGYWRDIGSLASYFACNQDALNNKIKLYLPMDGVILNARDGKWYCSYGASVDEDARICGGSIVGRGSYVEANALIGNSILCDDCTVEKGAVVKDSILDRGVLVKKNAVVAAQSVVGYGTQLGEGSHCLSRNLPAQSRLHPRVFFTGEEDGVVWEEDRFLFSSSKEQDLFVRFGLALARCFPGPFLVSEEGEGEAFFHLCQGLKQGDARVMKSDASHALVSAYSAFALNAYALHLIGDEKGAALRLFVPGGLSVARKERKRLIGAFRSAPSETERKSTYKQEERFEAERLYLFSLLSYLPSSVEGVSLQTEEDSLFTRALRLCSWRDSQGEKLRVGLSCDGEDCFVSFSQEESYSFDSLRAFFCQEKGLVYRPYEEEEERVSYGEYRELYDPCFALAALLCRMKEQTPKKLRLALRNTKQTFLAKRFSSYDGKYGSFTGHLEQLFRREGWDTVLYRPQGILRILPSALRGFRIYAEARKAEAAQELCNYVVQQLHPDQEKENRSSH